MSTNSNLLKKEIWSTKQILTTTSIQIQSSIYGNPELSEIRPRRSNTIEVEAIKNLQKKKSLRKLHLHRQDKRPGHLFFSCFSTSSPFSSSPFPSSFSSCLSQLLLMMGERLSVMQEHSQSQNRKPRKAPAALHKTLSRTRWSPLLAESLLIEGLF